MVGYSTLEASRSLGRGPLLSLSHRTQKLNPKRKTDEPIPDRAIPSPCGWISDVVS